MTIKKRLSVTVDPDTLAAAEKAVADGEAANLSAWVNDALRIKLEQGRRLTALSAFIEEYEGLHGEITDAEMAFAAHLPARRRLPDAHSCLSRGWIS